MYQGFIREFKLVLTAEYIMGVGLLFFFLSVLLASFCCIFLFRFFCQIVGFLFNISLVPSLYFTVIYNYVCLQHLSHRPVNIRIILLY